MLVIKTECSSDVSESRSKLSTQSHLLCRYISSLNHVVFILFMPFYVFLLIHLLLNVIFHPSRDKLPTSYCLICRCNYFGLNE